VSDAIQPACQDTAVDPEWWTSEHKGSHKNCYHKVATHICNNHCPLQEACLAFAEADPVPWMDMVIGGKVWVSSGNHVVPAFHQPQEIRCSVCTQDLLAEPLVLAS